MTIKEEVQFEEYKRAFAEAYKQGFMDAISVCKTKPSGIVEAYSQGFEDGAEAVKAMPQTDCVKVGKWYSFTDYVVEMEGDHKPKEFRIVPQTDCAWR